MTNDNSVFISSNLVLINDKNQDETVVAFIVRNFDEMPSGFEAKSCYYFKWEQFAMSNKDKLYNVKLNITVEEIR